ncbi:DUF4192 domain-containing protein [Actinomycetospora endophytica]|uniref:DUF4192 domain-containing protein n=1 Tax=Actinomycetospora endophytica TaxID=2291215 RepID=A0ABS8PGC3_9PSEU|nr:DUF4192 domain-containing protein [Actinomycetospora endophytica]MCD2197309.1 DUF4192 domain-containing protein [Actinomycetospora endophytica]
MSSRKARRRIPPRRLPGPLPSRPSPGPDDEPVVVRVGTPPELVASLPAMLGFVPEESVVAMAMHRRGERGRVGGMARVDLPADDGSHDPAETDRLLAAALRDRLRRTGPDELMIVVVSDGVPGVRPPQADLVDALRASFAEVEVPVTGAVWTARVAVDAPWQCYDECACVGTLPDPTGMQAAAEVAGAGRITYGSRDEVEAALAPEAAASGRRRRGLIDDAYRAALTDRELSGIGAARRDLDAVRRAAAEVGNGGVLAEEEIARLAVALGDPRVRDIALGFAAGHDDAVAPDHARALWRVLMRAVPAPEVAEPATLVAFASLDDGGGATLTVALERAMGADPLHRLSRLLGSIVTAGIQPSEVREMVVGAATEATARLTA